MSNLQPGTRPEDVDRTVEDSPEEHDARMEEGASRWLTEEYSLANALYATIRSYLEGKGIDRLTANGIALSAAEKAIESMRASIKSFGRSSK